MIRQIAHLCLGIIMATALLPATVAQAVTKLWITGTSNWNVPDNWFPTGVPGAGDSAIIDFSDGVVRTVTYNYTGPAITLFELALDQRSPGAAATTLSMSANALTSNFEYVGYAFNGKGIFNQSGGTNTIAAGAGYLDVGVFAGSTGTYNLSGAGALVSHANEYVGDLGTGYFNQQGGTNTIDLNRSLYLGVNANATGAYTLNSGSLSAGGEIIGLSGTGTFTQTGGSNTVGSLLTLGNDANSMGTYTLSGTGILTAGSMTLGYFGIGIFNQTGGANTVTSALTIADFNPPGICTYNLSGAGTLSAGTLIVGKRGSGAFNQTGGTTTIGHLEVGYQADGRTSTYDLSGGSATIGNAFVGGIDATGVLTVSGAGVLTVGGTLNIVRSGASSTRVVLSGGTINAAALNVVGRPERFNWTGGKLNLTSDVIFDSAAAETTTSAAFGPALAVGAARTFMITGNETLGGAGAFGLTLNSGGTHNVTGTLTIATNGTLTQNAGSTLAVPTITQAGGAVNGTLVNQTNFVYQSGAFNGRLLNQGTVHLGPSFTADNGVENEVTMTIVGGQKLTANGAGFDNRGALSLNDVTAVLAGTTLNNTGLIRGEGRITAPLNNNAGGEVRAETGKWLKFQGAGGPNAGRISLLGGIVEFTQPLTNGAAGQILGNGTVIVGGTGLTNQGQLIFSSGTGYVFGDVSNNTSNATKGVTITGNSNVTFWDDVTHAAGSLLKVQAGSSATFFGTLGGAGSITGGGDVYVEADLTPGASPASVNYDASVHLHSTAQLKIEVGGTTPGTQFDQLLVSGQLSLGGALQVSLINSFMPAAGNSFNILDWGALSGTFSSLQLPTLGASLVWNAAQLYTTGVLSVSSTLLDADFDEDGDVDGADLANWRRGFGESGATHMRGDTDSDSDSDGADFLTWQRQFGSTASVPNTGAVAEPTASILVLTLALIGATNRTVRRARD